MNRRKHLEISKDMITTLYHNQLMSMDDIAEQLQIPQQAIFKLMRYYDIPSRSRSEAGILARKLKKSRYNPPRGEDSPSWRGGRKVATRGYAQIYKREHPRADSHGYVMEHIVIWEEVHQKPLPEGWIIHHLNGITNDNRPENLIAMPNKSHYNLLAAKGKKIRELEAKVKLLEKALEQNQLIFKVEEN